MLYTLIQRNVVCQITTSVSLLRFHLPLHENSKQSCNTFTHFHLTLMEILDFKILDN